MNPLEIHQRNRIAWNEAAKEYEDAVERDIAFLRAGGRNFCPPELPFLADLGAWCRRAIHLQCAGGTDTLSLWNEGASEVVGIDISERMIECARRKSEALGAPATWYCCDVLRAPHELDATADLVYTGRGALCWVMDIDAWARVTYRLLKPGGRLFVFEGHPFMNLWQDGPSELVLDPYWGNYFERRPMSSRGWSEQYIGDLGMPAEQHAEKLEMLWNLGDVVNALVDAGLVLRRLEEHPDPFFDAFPHIPPEVLRRLPNTYSLLMRKP